MRHAFWLFLSLTLAFTLLVPQSGFSQQKLRLVALRVQFQPDEANTTTGDGTFDLSPPPADSFQVDPPPHNRSYFQDHLTFVKNYFFKASHGRLIVEGDVFPLAEEAAYQLDEPMTSYNPNTTPEDINAGLARLLRDAVLKADADPDLDFSQYDGVIVFHAGVGKDVDVGFDETPQDIPSLFITGDFLQRYLGQSGIEVDNGAVVIDRGIILPETESQEGLQLALNGILTANVGSLLGFLDLFSPSLQRSGAGRFALMDVGLFNADGLLPALPSAWTRVRAGWEQPVLVTHAAGEPLDIFPVLDPNGPRVYQFPINESEYFLVEHRFAGQPDLDSLRAELGQNRSTAPTYKEVLKTFLPDKVVFSPRGVLVDVDNPDRGLPGSGILIWHVDEQVIAQKADSNRINDDPSHRGVDLEEADGSQDIGQVFDIFSGGAGSELGWSLDYWYRENSAPLYRNEFSDSTIPNSRSYTNRAHSHLRLYDFSSRSYQMSFRAQYTIFQTGFPQTLSPGRFGHIQSLKLADVDHLPGEELLLLTDANRLLLLNGGGEAAWGDSLVVARIPGSSPVVGPPAVYTLPDSTVGVVALTRDGRIFLVEFVPALKPLVRTLQINFQCPAEITTFPVVEMNRSASGSNAPGLPVVYWACADGGVYQMAYQNGSWQLPELLFSVDEPVEKLHTRGPEEVVAVTHSGKVYQNGGLIFQSEAPLFQPVGDSLLLADGQGRLFLPGRQDISFVETGLHRFDAPPVAFAESPELEARKYVLAGNNRVMIFNYNLTLLSDFPNPLYRPERNTRLFLAPLVGAFVDDSGSLQPGFVVADPAGMITALDVEGRVLPEFPVATGDSIRVSPALGDLDGDADQELVAVTKGNTIYVWDFPNKSTNFPTFTVWRQENGNALNQNRPEEPPAYQGLPPQQQPETAAPLLPKEAVYCWPNPAREGFTFIRYYLKEASQVRIQIFDLAGDLVAQMEGPGLARTDNEVRWDLSGVQSGVYFGRVEANNGSQTEVRFIKIAVVK
ncbi:MAG: T9SS C-terminal target domain-containing protein [Calditrichaeota bacterium]|nr:MAG: T9SS C-terminal target domain-containing protein [Calditrichota bacterium]